MTATWEEIRDEIAGMLADGEPLEDVISKLQKMQNAKQMTNFEQITKDEATLTDWLQEKMCFCTEIPCDECIAYKECWHQGNDTDYSNADLWNAWLKQPHKE